MKKNTLSILKSFTITMVLVIGISGISGCSSPTDKANKFYENGLQLLEKGEFAKANVEFRNALQLDRTMTKAIWGQVRVAEKQGKLRELYKLLNAVLVYEPEHLQALVKMSRLLLIAGKLDKSLEMSDKSMLINNQDLAVLSLRAAILLKLDDANGAVSLANQVLDKDPRFTDAFIVLATERLIAKDAQKALEYLDRGLKNNDKNIALQLLNIKTLENLSKPDLVEDVYKRLINYYPEVVGFNYGLALFYLKHDKKDDAEKEYRAVINKKPKELKPKLKLIKFLNVNKGVDAGRKQLEIFSQQEPENVDLKFALIQFYIGRNNALLANKLLTRIVADAADVETSIKAKGILAGILLKQGDKEAAENIINEILDKDQGDENALILKASIDIDRQKYDDAIGSLRLVLQGKPNSSRALFLLGKTYNVSGSPELADEQYFEAFKVSNFSEKYGLSYAQFLLKRKQPKRAEKIVLDVLNVARNSLPAMKLLAKSRIMSGDWVGAQQVADVIKRGGGKTSIAEQIENTILVQKKDYTESIALLKGIYQSTPDNIRPIAALVRTYLLAGKAIEAGSFLDAVINANPKNINAHILRGQVYSAQGAIKQAIDTYEKVVSQDPTIAMAYYQLALAHIRDNNNGKANEILSKGLSVSPESFALHLTQANLYEKTGKIDKAINSYSYLLSKNPGADIVANNLASLLTEYRTDKASLDKAYIMSQRFKRSDVPQFKDTFGWANYRIGKYADANPLLKSAIEQLPRIPEFHYHLGMNYIAQNNIPLARKELEKVLELVGDKPFAKSDEIRAVLKKL